MLMQAQDNHRGVVFHLANYLNQMGYSLAQQLAPSSQREVELTITNEVLKSHLFILQEKMLILLGSHDEALL